MKNRTLMVSVTAFHFNLKDKIRQLATLFLLNKQQYHSLLTSG
jgi:hypothetical protein